VGPIALLLAKFASALDRQKIDAAVSLFTTDGVFQPAGNPIRGEIELEAFFAKRHGDMRRRTCHTWSNLVVRPLSEGRSQYEVVLTNYVFDPGVSEDDVEVRVGAVWGVCRGAGPDSWCFESHFHERIHAAAMRLTAPSLPLAKA
jgi:hypothetical protein